MEKLKNKDHICMIYTDEFDYISLDEVGWCDNNKCTGKIDINIAIFISVTNTCNGKTKMVINPHSMAKRMERFEQDLRNKGHKCISIIECYPQKINWCQTEPCIHSS